MNKKVAILTSFSDFQKAYSLNIVVQTQIKMLLLSGYEPTVIVHDTAEPEGIYAHPAVKIKYIPNVACHNEVRKDETFDEDVDALEGAIFEALKDQDVVLTHDIIYQPACLKHNFASRRVAQKLPNLRWLHWIHSATSPDLLNQVLPIFEDKYTELIKLPFPNSFYVYPESYTIPAVAKNYNVDVDKVKHVPHATDICGYLGVDKNVEKLCYDKGILEADAVCTYPIRLDRGKQVQFVIKTMAMLKDFGLTVKVIIVDFHSTGGDKLTYRDQLKEIAIDYGLSQDELIWTSEVTEEWSHEVPQSVVRDFFLLSNVFIMPSVSETYSLITQEAMLAGNVVVLNKDFPPFRAIYGEHPIYKKYSSAFDVQADLSEARSGNSWTQTEYGDADLPPDARKSAEKAYHRGTAGLLAARLQGPEHQQKRWVIRERNLTAVFKKYLEPLFY